MHALRSPIGPASQPGPRVESVATLRHPLLTELAARIAITIMARTPGPASRNAVAPLRCRSLAGRMRREAGAPEVVRHNGTIRREEAGVPGAPTALADALALIYGGEANTAYIVHNGTTTVTITTATLPGIVGGTDAVTEAFDEPLSADVVTQIVTPFIVA